jgi:hypothetical protein
MAQLRPVFPVNSLRHKVCEGNETHQTSAAIEKPQSTEWSHCILPKLLTNQIRGSNDIVVILSYQVMRKFFF